MIQTIERDVHYLIPVTDTDSAYQQTQEIPAIHTELQINEFAITYLRYPIIPGEDSPLDIVAGGKDLETAGNRIRNMMRHRLEQSVRSLESPTPALNTLSEVVQLSQFFAHNSLKP